MGNSWKIGLFIFLALGSGMSCTDKGEAGSREQSPVMSPEGFLPGLMHLGPAVNQMGDTAYSGVPYSIRGKRMEATPSDERSIINVNEDQGLLIAPPIQEHFIPVSRKLSLSEIPAYHSSNYVSDFVAVNNVGDTVPTGILLPATEHLLQLSRPRPVPVGHPFYAKLAARDIQYFSREHGLVSDYLHSIMQDSRGIIWIGTNDNGLVRYDGETFMTLDLNMDHGFEVTCMMEDSRGQLWFGTSLGLIRYDGKDTYTMTEAEGLLLSHVISMEEDRHGNMWFGTFRGLSRYDGESFIHFTEKEGLSQEHVWCIEEDEQGALWLGTSNGLNHFIPDEGGLSGVFKHYYLFDPLLGNQIRDLAVDRQGNIWVGNWDAGVCKLLPPREDREGRVSYFDKKNGFPAGIILSLAVDQEDNIWVGSDDAGMFCIEENKDGESYHITHFGEREGLTQTLVYDVMPDREGNIWAATAGGGLCRYRPGSFEYLGKQHGMPGYTVSSIEEDHEGNHWFGTMGGGLLKLENQQMTQFNTAAGFPARRVYSLLEDCQERLWIGTLWEGLICYHYPSDDSPGYFEYFSETRTLPDSSIHTIAEDSYGNIWLGTRHEGLVVFTGEHFFHYGLEEGLPDDLIMDIFVGREGNIWVATGRTGLVRLKTDSLAMEAEITIFTAKEGLSDNTINCIYGDTGEALWIGTENGGLNYLTELSSPHPQIRKLTKSEGMPSNCIWSISRDQKKSLWIGTEAGLVLIPGGTWENVSRMYHLGEMDGVQETEFVRGSVCCDSENRLWWGAGEGVVHLDVGEFRKEKHEPSVQLRSVEIDNMMLDYQHMPDSLSGVIRFTAPEPFSNVPGDLELPFNMNRLRFQFASSHTSVSHEVRYSYRISRISKSWSHPEPSGSAEFSSLPFGNHVFEVKAINEEGDVSQVVSYPFRILPPWYLSWLAWALYITGLGSLVLMSINLRTRQLRSQRTSLRENVRKATLEITEQKELILEQNSELRDTIEELKTTQQQLVQSEKMASLGVLTSGVAHEINNPLNFIQTGIYSLQSIHENTGQYSKEEFEKVREQILKGMQDGISRISNIVNSLSHFSKTEERMDKSCSLNVILNNCLVILNNQTQDRIGIITDLEEDDILIPGNEGRLHQVFMNLIHNAIQAIEGEGKIHISTRKQSKTDLAVVRIRDNGTGIRKEDLSKIWEPFFTTKDPGEGTGLGLSIVYSIVHEHFGSIEVESEPGEGTVFTLMLPLA